jgi:hypothetical protein
MYLLQIQTLDFSLQLKTEIESDTIQGLQEKAKLMVKRNKAVVGMKYLICKYTKKENGFTSETLKTGIIMG